jgi:AraC-like DNA-binding protein
MDLVVKLLLTTQLSIKEIAGQAGYDDLVHFRKIFFRKFGMTPRQYRNLHIAGRVNSE